MTSGSSFASSSVRKYAPFPSARWWLLHLVAIASVYTIGHLLFGR